MTDDADPAGQGRNGALAAMLEVCSESDVIEHYRTIASGFDPDDYRTLIDVAWRHQFDDDRLHFKRDIRDLQQHVSRRALERVERP
ncbi:hypothetical protein ABIH81_02485 [Micromonospora sp. HUAS YX12]|uniref:Uncharacterized protein n=1 Tax=Micromonospora sp. HUAS YX12 TaxID=3156396 RepID=A0AAU7R296_9ACTN